MLPGASAAVPRSVNTRGALPMATRAAADMAVTDLDARRVMWRLATSAGDLVTACAAAREEMPSPASCLSSSGPAPAPWRATSAPSSSSSSSSSSELESPRPAPREEAARAATIESKRCNESRLRPEPVLLTPARAGPDASCACCRRRASTAATAAAATAAWSWGATAGGGDDDGDGAKPPTAG